MTDVESLFRTQYGVVQKIRGERPELMPQLSWRHEDAESYRQWLLNRDSSTSLAAQEEEANNFPGGNHNYYIWNHGFSMRALKDATYHVVSRQVSDWEEFGE